MVVPPVAFVFTMSSLLGVIAQTDTRDVSGSDVIVMVAVVVGAAAVTRLLRPVVRAVLTWLARRSHTTGDTRWRVRTPRLFGETAEQAELRRRQRIAATAAGLSRVISMLLWVVVAVVILQRAEIDPAFAISGAGFLGVAMAVGGQHSVNDFLTGLHILLEDRFGEGDKLRLQMNDEDVVARVDQLGAFSTRLEGPDATFHIPNREMTRIINLSQRGSTAELAFQPTGEVPAVGSRASKASIAAAVRARYQQTSGFDGSRDGLVIDEIEPAESSFTVKMRTARPLTDQQRDALGRTASDSRENTDR